MSDALTTAPGEVAPFDVMKVIEGLTLPEGAVNTDDDTLRAQIAASIRRGHPQVKRQPVQTQRVCLVGGGPSLNDTLPELVELLRDGAALVTVNGAYQWALERNLEPKMQIVMDARACNARFVDPPLPRCHYVMSSTCHADLWDRLDGRDRVWIWHPVQKTDPVASVLDDYYARAWEWVGGGTTVITRALFVLRLLGYVRFDLFGVDSCYFHDAHHAYSQPENEADSRYRITACPTGHPELARTFLCAGWHLKQVEDLLRIIRVNGDHFLLNFHGDGLVAYLMRSNAAIADFEEVSR